MEQRIKELIKTLKRTTIGSSLGVEPPPDDKINIWFVIAKLEEILLNEKAHPGK